jgi:glycosyltransferase involved in cell wall biosynthesis
MKETKAGGSKPNRSSSNEREITSVKISCLLAVRNKVKTIRSCLASILKCDFDEVVVVDGNSTDGTSKIIDQFPVIHLYDQGKNISAARNIGLQNITCGYVVILDGDQRIREDFCIKLRAILESKQWDALFCDEIFEGSSSWAKAYQEIWAQVSAVGKDFVYRPRVFRKSIISAVRGYDENYTSFEDGDLFNRISLLHPSVCESGITIYNDVQDMSVLSQYKRGLWISSALYRYMSFYPTEWFHVVGLAPMGFFSYTVVAAKVLSRTRNFRIAFDALMLRLAWSIGYLVGFLRSLLRPRQTSSSSERTE